MKLSTVAICIFFVAALTVAAPLTDELPPPAFSSVEKATIKGILEKHTLPDVIKFLFHIEANRTRQIEGKQGSKREEPIQVEKVIPQLGTLSEPLTI